MKKTLILSTLLIVMASYGGSALLANAQSLTPAQTAAIQQQLDVAKAQLVQLEMQEGMIPQGDNDLPATAAIAATQASAPVQTMAAMTLSASDVVAMNTALTSLTAVLVSLQTKIAQNPQFATTNGQDVISALQGIGNTLASIVTEAKNGNIAMAAPQGLQASGSQSVAQTAPVTAVNTQVPAAVAGPATLAAITPAPAAVVPQTAQASSAFSFGALNWPLIIVIILIVAAIAIWLWWDDGEEVKRPVVKLASTQPQRPLQPTFAPSTTQPSMIVNNNQATQPAATPMSSAVAAPMDQKRKPA